MKTFNLILLTLLILLTYSSLNAQECGTKPVPIDSLQKLPWFYNRNYLNELEDTLAYKRSIKSDKYIENVNFNIPIHIWIYILEDGSAGGTEELPLNTDVQALMDELNTGFRNNNTSIRFYISDISYVKNDTVNFSQIRCHTLARSNRDSSAYNVHIVNSITDARGLTVYGFGNRAVFIRRKVYLPSYNSIATFTHETGHYFGLPHTFRYTEKQRLCLREPVTREFEYSLCNPLPGTFQKRCYYTGDFICDTHADPNMYDNGSVDTLTLVWECGEEGLCEDQNGDVYTPDARNYMAYVKRKDFLLYCQIL